MSEEKLLKRIKTLQQRNNDLQDSLKELLMPPTEGCVLGATNETKIEALEKDMNRLKTMVFWLVTSSFATLASLVVGLVVTIVKS